MAIGCQPVLGQPVPFSPVLIFFFSKSDTLTCARVSRNPNKNLPWLKVKGMRRLYDMPHSLILVNRAGELDALVSLKSGQKHPSYPKSRNKTYPLPDLGRMYIQVPFPSSVPEGSSKTTHELFTRQSPALKLYSRVYHREIGDSHPQERREQPSTHCISTTIITIIFFSNATSLSVYHYMRAPYIASDVCGIRTKPGIISELYKIMSLRTTSYGMTPYEIPFR